MKGFVLHVLNIYHLQEKLLSAVSWMVASAFFFFCIRKTAAAN